MYQEILTQAGLTAEQAQIYEILLKQGPSTARQITKNTPLKRSLVYKILDDLGKLGLLARRDEVGKVSVFEPAHPMKLKELAEAAETRAKNAAEALETVLGALTSDFNLVSGRPGVRFYEGLEGVKKTLEDTLLNNPQKELLVFSDVAGYAKHLGDWNAKYYAPKRLRLNILEKSIVPNTPAAMEWLKNYKANSITEPIFIDHNLFKFATEINIYSNRVSFITLSEKSHIGVIIENKDIYETLKSIFNLVWQSGKQKNATPPLLPVPQSKLV